jgi:hypothetical protein
MLGSSVNDVVKAATAVVNEGIEHAKEVEHERLARVSGTGTGEDWMLAPAPCTGCEE